ncbi:MAG: hypothetical protein Q4F66_11905 [Clostridium sp.]|nr:hypothetical protein [Clostridium sp.]
MKIKKILSIGALALTITTCTSMSIFAAEYAGTTTRNQAAKEIAINAYFGGEIVNNLGITVKTPVKSYVQQSLITKIIDCVDEGIADKSVKERVIKIIQDGYDNGYGFDKILDSIIAVNNEADIDITTNETFGPAKSAMENMLKEFYNSYHDGKLDTTIKNYFKVKELGAELSYGKNSNDRLVVSLEKGGQIVLQVSSENVDALEKEIRENIHSWSDLNDYFNKVNKAE